jgi:uncharacterized membrane protein YcaP (DUF421 family)
MDLALRAIVLYAFLVLVTRVVGRRELAALSPFDLILLIVLGDAIQQGLTQDDYSVTGAVIVVATIAVLQVGTAYLSFRSKRARRVLEGNPVVLIERGGVIERNLNRERLSLDELTEEMRTQQIATIDEVEWGILEANGTISFIKRDQAA